MMLSESRSDISWIGILGWRDEQADLDRVLNEWKQNADTRLRCYCWGDLTLDPVVAQWSHCGIGSFDWP